MSWRTQNGASSRLVDSCQCARGLRVCTRAYMRTCMFCACLLRSMLAKGGPDCFAVWGENLLLLDSSCLSVAYGTVSCRRCQVQLLKLLWFPPRSTLSPPENYSSVASINFYLPLGWKAGAARGGVLTLAEPKVQKLRERHPLWREAVIETKEGEVNINRWPIVCRDGDRFFPPFTLRDAALRLSVKPLRLMCKTLQKSASRDNQL